MQFRKPIFALLACMLVFPAAACNLQDIILKGSTSRSVTVEIIDSTDGTPETGVVFNTSGIDLWYRRELSARVAITEATLAALTTAWSSGGFLHISDGSYRLDIPDAALATGAQYVEFGGTVTGMVVICGRVRLVDYSLEDSVRMGLTGLANATPGAAGGLQIAGSNAATTYATLTVAGATAFTGNVTMPAGLNITQSVSNTPALVITGNGTGNGATITSGSGATGTGLAVVSAATNGTAVTLAGVGTGNGLTATGGTTGNGISGVGGATSGAGARYVGTAGNSPAVTLVGQGSAAGLLSTGGATGPGVSAVGGATSGVGLLATGTAGNSAAISLVGQGSAAGLLTTGGATGAGVSAVGGATSGAGISATSTSGAGLSAAGGTAGAGILATGGTTGHGVSAIGGATSGDGVRAVGTAGNSNAMNLVGQGSAHGLLATGGATGHGFRLVGGATSGNGISTAFTAPSACSAELGSGVCGTLSGTHSSTTADLGTNAPGTVSDVIGMSVYFPTRVLTRAITSYDTATGIATFDAIDADITLTNGDPWILFGTAPTSGGGGAPSAATVAAAVWDLDATGHQTQGTFGQVLGDSTSTASSVWTKTNFLPSATAGSAGGVFIAGTNAATTVTTALTTTFTGNLTGSVGSVTGAVGSVTGAVGSVTGAVGSVTGNVGGNVTGSVGSVTGAVGSVTGNVGGNVVGNVNGSVATATALGANAITAAATAPDFATEINTGMATSAALATAQTSLDDIPTNAELATALGTADDAVLAALSALPTSIRDIVIEDQGSGISLGCALAVASAFNAGDIVTVAGNTTWRDPSNGEVRITSVITSNGNRTASVTCPTY